MRRAVFLAALLSFPFVALAQAGSAQGGTGGAAGSPATPPAQARPFSREAVLEVVESHRQEIQDCYENAMAQRGSTAKNAPKGRVTLSWVITEDGLPAEVKVKRSAIKDELVTDCMVQAVRSWEFPRPSKRQPIEFPFDLKPHGAQAPGQKERK